MSKYTFKCEGCGQEHEYALLDGYYVGDRLLEGVMFEVRIADDGTFSVAPRAGMEAYLIGLNMPHWIKLMTEYAKKRDLFTCPTPKCREDIENPTDY